MYFICFDFKVLLFNNLGVMYDENGDKNKALDAFKSAIKTTEGIIHVYFVFQIMLVISQVETPFMFYNSAFDIIKK